MMVYRLVAIVLRMGSCKSDHFYMAARSAPDRWMVHNSSDISEVAEVSVELYTIHLSGADGAAI